MAGPHLASQCHGCVACQMRLRDRLCLSEKGPGTSKSRPQYAPFICSTASSTLMFPAGKALLMTWMKTSFALPCIT